MNQRILLMFSCRLFVFWGRDANFKSEQLSTADPEKNNIRQNLKSELIPGMMMCFGLIGQNFRYTDKTEERFKNVGVVCNKQESSGPVDQQGLRYRVHHLKQQNRDAGSGMPAKTLDDVEDRMDRNVPRKVRIAGMSPGLLFLGVCTCFFTSSAWSGLMNLILTY